MTPALEAEASVSVMTNAPAFSLKASEIALASVEAVVVAKRGD